MTDQTFAQVFALGSRSVDRDVRPFVIAEVGINHEGSVDVCAAMIEAAQRAGADAIKLQVLPPVRNYAPGTKSHVLFSQAWLPPESVERMFNIGKSIGIEVFATCGDAETLDWIDKLGPCAHKISSGLLTHVPLIKHAARKGRPIIMSNGMAMDGDLSTALQTCLASSNREVVVLHCTSQYPCPPEQLQLSQIDLISRENKVLVGFSDHSLGIKASVSAVAAGAVAIEKHFTLDSARPGFDHAISLEPRDFASMVSEIELAFRMRGTTDGRARMYAGDIARQNSRVISAAISISKGERITHSHIAFLRQPIERPKGARPIDVEKVIGAVAARDFERFQPIDLDSLERTSS